MRTTAEVEVVDKTWIPTINFLEDIYPDMTSTFLQEIETLTNTLSEFSYRLVESFYEENQISLAQQRIEKLRADIDKEREKIAQWRMVISRRKEQDRYRRQSEKSSSDNDAGD
jgi:predicted RNase H-like nuclease (RuvC/YqgF family)